MLENDITADPRVRNGIIVALWIPPILLIFGVTFSVVAFLVRFGLSGDFSTVSQIRLPVNSTTASFAVGGAIMFLYLNVFNATFGVEVVEQSQEQAEEFTDGGEGGSD